MRSLLKQRTMKLGRVHSVNAFMPVGFLFLARVCGDSVPYVTVFRAVSPGPRGRSAEWQAIHCVVLHDVLGELQFVK